MVGNKLSNTVCWNKLKEGKAADLLDLNHSLPPCNHKLLEYVCAAFFFLVSSLASWSNIVFESILSEFSYLQLSSFALGKQEILQWKMQFKGQSLILLTDFSVVGWLQQTFISHLFCNLGPFHCPVWSSIVCILLKYYLRDDVAEWKSLREGSWRWLPVVKG